MRTVVVIGGGAAGMMASIFAAREGSRVILLEKNEKLGKKIYITGKGRCNFTNDCERDVLMDSICHGSRFLFSAFSDFSPADVITFFESLGLKCKTERGGRVFPVSDHASDVTAALSREMKRLGVEVRLETEVKSIDLESDHVTETQVTEDIGDVTDARAQAIPAVKGVTLTDGSRIDTDAVIVATGGLSYPSTGSTGDGLKFAKSLGLSVTPQRPSLVPMETQEEDAARMQGLSLRNVSVQIRDGKKVLFDEFGEMMFTHFGVTGPLILSASARVGDKLLKKPLKLLIDLKPALEEKKLDERIVRDFAAASNKQLKNVLTGLYPTSMVPVMLERSGLSGDLPAREVTKVQRRTLVELTKALPFTLTGLRGFNEAIITSGGVSVREIKPDTMEVKKIRGLYFAGEVLDLDALTGGFNLQIAWATGRSAGMAAGQAAASPRKG